MKIGKLDRRHNGHGIFRYYVRFTSAELEKFVDVRNWCWQTWGASCELDTFYHLENPNQKWGWVRDSYNTKIYLGSDAEYQWFLLKWK